MKRKDFINVGISVIMILLLGTIFVPGLYSHHHDKSACSSCSLSNPTSSEDTEFQTRKPARRERGQKTYCIVMGKEGGEKTINRNGTFIEYQGKEYYICCDNCKEPFTSNPNKYILTTRKPTEEEIGNKAYCTVMGKETGEKTINRNGTFIEYQGEEYYICCDKCKEPFTKNPDKFTLKTRKPAEEEIGKNAYCAVMGKEFGEKTVNLSGTMVRYKGNEYYICSDHCLKPFKEDPENFEINLDFLRWDDKSLNR